MQKLNTYQDFSYLSKIAIKSKITAILNMIAIITMIAQPNNKVNRKVKIITDEWLAPSLACKMQTEGCEIILCAKRPTKILKGTIERQPYNERLEIDADLIIYEDKSNKGESSEQRQLGYSVIGGDKLTDRLELDRTWANKIAKMSGILVPEMYPVESFEEVRNLILEKGGKFVLKQQGKIDEIKGLNFVAKMPNSEDLLDFLPILEKNWIEGVKKDFVLQEKVEGHEMAVGSFWNGHEFMKDKDGDELCYENWEHKALFPGNLGESTGEQYTVIQLTKAKYSKLFTETLDKCRELLKQVDYRGYFDVNTIVTEKGAYFLEFTPRMGVPLTSGMLEIHKSNWFDFLKSMADGLQDAKFKCDDDYCIVSWLYTKPFPFVNSHKMTQLYENESDPQGMEEIADTMSFRMSNSEDVVVNFDKDFTKEDWQHIHPDGLKFKDGKLLIANPDGYVLTATETGKTPEEAGEKLNNLLKKVIIPKAFWRNDFCHSNFHKSKDDLEKWGYIVSKDIKDKEKQEIKIKNEQVKTEEKRKAVREALKKIVL